MINSRDKRYFKAAANMADLSTYKKCAKVGCVVTYRNNIISTGCNKEQTHPLQKKYNIIRGMPDHVSHKMHAEIDALRHIIDLDIDWSKVSIYIYRKRSDKPFSLTRPCKSCMQLIKDLGIKHLYYTGDDDFQYEYLGE